MYTSIIRACLLLIGFILPLAVNAAGLGRLTINSSLGQPLSAEIDLISVSNEELSSLRANIASHEAFTQAGIRYEPFYSTFKISIEPRANGQPYIKITSPHSINEPFLNVLMELNWASGRLLREYTVLLDPPESKMPEPVTPIIQAVPEDTENNIPIEEAPAEQSATLATAPQAGQVNKAHKPELVRAKQSPEMYGPVLQGDTLSSIARQVKPEEVNINQMLVALYRANREAFIANNMNLLRTGSVLRIPDMRELTDISEKEARAEVKIQVSDWHQYRQNLASSTQEAQEPKNLKQADSGQITATVDSTATGRSETSEEILRLSSGEKLSQEAYSNLNTQERLRMMEEDAIARNLALKEANERVAMLEKNIENLQKLLALQNPELAQAQVNAQTLTRSQQPEKDPIEDISSVSVAATDTELDYLSEDNSAIAIDANANYESTKITPSASVEEIIATGPVATMESSTASVESISNPVLFPELGETSLLDEIMDYATYIGAASVILLLALIAAILRRRRKAAETEAEIEESRYEELSSALRNKTAAAVAVAHAVDNEKDDFDAFDKSNQFFPNDDIQDPESATRIDPSLNADEQTKNLEQEPFESEQAITLDFSDEKESESEDSFSELGSSFDSDAFDENIPESGHPDDLSQHSMDNAVDFNVDFDENKPSSNTPHFDQSSDEEHAIDFSKHEQGISDDDNDYELKIDFDETDKSSGTNESKIDLTDEESETESKLGPESSSEVENMLDFSVDPATIDLSDETSDEDGLLKKSLEVDENSLATAESNAKTEILSDTEANENENPPGDSSQQSTDIDFSSINLDLEDSQEISGNQATDVADDATASISADSGTKSEQWHEIETKIDLARAYLEMEDTEGAKEMLEEVVQEGDEKQRKAAKELLENL